MVYLIILLFLLLCGGLAVLTILNITTLVHFTILSWHTPDLPVGLWLLLAFFLGALLMYFIAISEARGDRHELKSLRTHVAELDVQQREQARPSESTKSRRTGSLMPMPGASRNAKTGGLQQELPPQQFH